jgi:hypothetical protein
MYRDTLDAITDDLNASKGDPDPAEWLPSGPSARCIYAIHWVTVKYRWKLSVDGSERAVLANLFAGSCGDKQVTIPTRRSSRISALPTSALESRDHRHRGAGLRAAVLAPRRRNATAVAVSGVPRGHDGVVVSDDEGP